LQVIFVVGTTDPKKASPKGAASSKGASAPVIGALAPALGALASSFMSKQLGDATGEARRVATRWAAEARREAMLWAGVAVALGMAGLCLTVAAFFALAPRIGQAEAAAILGGGYLLAAGIAILARRRTS
jgi:hypothetical protein